MGDRAGTFDVIIIGAGAAGLMCAGETAARGKTVALLEHNPRVGLKIAISGGGRCNFTNLQASPDNYLSGHPDFCKSALARYTPWDFLNLVEKHGIPYHEKKLGQQFCDRSSKDIIEMLVSECRTHGAQIHCDCRVADVTKGDRFRLTTSRGIYESTALVVATGGLSFPKLGASDFGYRLAGQFGLKVTDLQPGLVPLTTQGSKGKAFQGLSGLSLPVRTRWREQAFEEALLFTHRGISGPAVLQISSYCPMGASPTIDLLPNHPGLSWVPSWRGAGRLSDILNGLWPRRFTEAWLQQEAIDKPVAQYAKAECEAIARKVHEWVLPVSGTEGYPKAEVTLGGVATTELSSKTMEARSVRGLFFIGEVVDVTGWLGGYNFQWAWASAHAAAEAIAA